MLVLSRKQFEMIQIGDDIKIKVLRTGLKTVKIGIEAPGHIRVLRAEICDVTAATEPSLLDSELPLEAEPASAGEREVQRVA